MVLSWFVVHTVFAVRHARLYYHADGRWGWTSTSRSGPRRPSFSETQPAGNEVIVAASSVDVGYRAALARELTPKGQHCNIIARRMIPHELAHDSCTDRLY